MTSAFSIGPAVDTMPRPLPHRTAHRGQYVTLEPLGARHASELWDAAQAVGASEADAGWTYMGYGPFPTQEALRTFCADFGTQHDPVAFAIRPHSTGQASGWLTLMEIQPKNAAIELGNIWFSPRLQRTKAATEAMFILMRHAMDDLGYRRLVWKCNALNEPSRRAAARLGFTYEGTLRAHLTVKGHRRDTAFFSILDDEWPERRDAILAWLDPSNFDATGTARTSLKAAG